MFPFPNGQPGSYRLIRRIGGGGMGEVYLAEDTRMGVTRQVAIKTIRAEIDPYPDQAAMKDAERLFRREMQAITRLDHPLILPLYDFGEERAEDTILTYMVMPFRPEGSLASWLQKRGATQSLSLAEAAHFVGQAALALQHVHTHGLVHQDVKPANFLIRDRDDQRLPDILLADFGIVKIATATATASQSIRGTPSYMAPEQWDGHPVPATDQYALAIMAYLLLTRQYPFKGSMEQVMRQHFHAQPQPPGTLNPALPPDLDTVLLHALEKSPGERFASISAFANAFQQATTRRAQSAPPPPALRSLPDEAHIPPISPRKPAAPSPPPGARPVAADPATVYPEHNTPAPLPSRVVSSSASQADKDTPFPVLSKTELPTQPPVPAPFQPGRRNTPRTRARVLITVSVLVLLILAGGVGVVLSHRSPDGSTWTAQSSSVSTDLWGVAWSGSQFVAVGAGGTVLTSPDGSAWATQSSAASTDLYGVAWSGYQFVAVGTGDTIFTSPDGSTTAQSPGVSADLYGVAWLGSQFVAVGTGGTILTSPDGSTWTAQSSDTSQDLYRVAWSGSQFVAVGQNGTILTSPDGSTWTPQSSDVSAYLLGVAWSGSQFVAVGTGGTILTSPDGSAWTAQSPGVSADLYGVAWSGSKFVAVGTGGTIYTSPDGSTWTAHSSGGSADLYGVAWSGSQFVAVGAGGTILTSP